MGRMALCSLSWSAKSFAVNRLTAATTPSATVILTRPCMLLSLVVRGPSFAGSSQSARCGSRDQAGISPPALSALSCSATSRLFLWAMGGACSASFRELRLVPATLVGPFQQVDPNRADELLTHGNRPCQFAHHGG